MLDVAIRTGSGSTERGSWGGGDAMTFEWWVLQKGAAGFFGAFGSSQGAESGRRGRGKKECLKQPNKKAALRVIHRVFVARASRGSEDKAGG